MDDVSARILEIEDERARLRPVMERLAERLGAGENGVRAELNAAIARDRELGRELHELERASGRYVEEPEVMYGPPFSPPGGSPPMPMYGPPPSPPPGRAEDDPKQRTSRLGFLRRWFGGR